MAQNMALVTGGSAGIGFSVAEQLLEQGFDVLVTSRNAGRANEAANRLNAGANVRGKARGLDLDLADLNSVLTLIQSMASLQRPLDLLVTNAGVKIQKPFRRTAQGFEWHYGINHLGHYLLTRELARIGHKFHLTTVASVVARLGQPKNWQIHDIDVGASAQYAASKLANLAFAQAIHEGIPDWARRLTASSAHPGFTKAEPYGSAVTRFGEIMLAQSCESGAKPIVAASISPSTATPFTYLGPKQWELWGKPAQARIPSTASSDLAKYLVTLSEEQLKQAGF